MENVEQERSNQRSQSTAELAATTTPCHRATVDAAAIAPSRATHTHEPGPPLCCHPSAATLSHCRASPRPPGIWMRPEGTVAPHHTRASSTGATHARSRPRVVRESPGFPWVQSLITPGILVPTGPATNLVYPARHGLLMFLSMFLSVWGGRRLRGRADCFDCLLLGVRRLGLIHTLILVVVHKIVVVELRSHGEWENARSGAKKTAQARADEVSVR